MSGWLRHLVGDLRALCFPDREAGQALPVMDGAWTPNRRLDDARPLGEDLPACDDLVDDGAGGAFVSAGNAVWHLSGVDLSDRRVFATMSNEAGALARVGEALYVGVAEVGVVRLDASGHEVARLETANGRPLGCVTAITPLPDGRLVVTEGSAHHPPARWCHDLMEKRASGRVLIAAADLSHTSTVKDGLAWPAGVLVQRDGAELWVTESWRHAVHRLALDGTGKPLLRNLPAYPARISSDGDGGAWLALLAARTHLVELVLREQDYREDMLATVDPAYWIAPSLHGTGHYLEPLQGGALKKLGMLKPWAPPRSYGLVVHVAADGECRASLHSRAGGRHHGILSVRTLGDRVLAVSKGGSRLLDLGDGTSMASSG